MTSLFEPLPLRGVTLPNRIAVSPMCTYSANEGQPSDWHLAHLGALAGGGAGLVLLEATAVEARGRISPADLGLWSDQQVEPMARITRLVRKQGAVAGIQLAHAGRKAATWPPSQGTGTIPLDRGGWIPVAPSALAFAEGHATPEILSVQAIDALVSDFARAAQRAEQAGFGVIEIHAAHGYLLHEFLSPLSNQRQDAYGGSLENRWRFLLETVRATRRKISESLPLLVRLSATDWAASGGWSIEETVELAKALRDEGVDLIDTSSGGTLPAAVIPLGPGYQVPFAERIRREAHIATGAVGLITSPAQAAQIIANNQADLVLLGRELLRNPFWPVHAAATLGIAVPWPRQYLRAAPAGSLARKPTAVPGANNP